MSKGSGRGWVVVLVGMLLPSSAWGSPSKKAAESAPIEVSNECLRGGDQLLVHVALPVKYKPPYDSLSARYLYQLVCQLDTRSCSAIEITLKDVDRGGKLGPWDLDRYTQVKLTASTNNTYVIKGPDLKTFTVDLDAGTVNLLESTHSVKDLAKGSTRCEVQDFQQCLQDADCVKGHHCSSEEGKCRKRAR